MSFINKIIIFIVTAMWLLSSGCHNKVYNEAEGNIADATSRSNQALQKSDHDAKPQPALVVNPGLYVDKTPINLAKAPGWLKGNIVIRGEDLPFSYYSRVIVNGGDHGGQLAHAYTDYKATDYKLTKNYKATQAFLPPPPSVSVSAGEHVFSRYQLGLDPSVKISLNYSGNVKGALDLLAAKTGYVYSINGDEIYWQAYVTKTFNVAFMPGTSDYMMGKAGGGGGTGTAGASAGAGSAVVSGGFLDESANAQYSNMKGTLSVWKDLDTTIKQLLSPGGTVIVSEATTSVTVRDKPANVDLVSHFIRNFNKNLTAQVLIKIEVLDILLSDQFNFGINWDIVQANLGKGTNFTFAADSSTPITIASFTAGAANPTLGMIPNGKSSFIAPLITALQQQGRVSVVTEPRVVSLNNQVSAVRIVNQQGYLQSIQLTSFGSTTSSSVNLQNQITSQVTPGIVVTGLTLYVLPKIMNNKVYLQVNADLSTNNGFTPISSTGVTSTTASPQPTIQVPNITQKQFNQRSVVASGDTMVLSGFRQVTNNANTQEVFNQADLGGRAAEQKNIETIILITPIILHGCA